MSLPPAPEAFRLALYAWHKGIHRPMPWKGEKDPYRIWLSEIILQQTRVDQGKAYYEKFISAFPNIQALATSEENTVLKLWEGLGYYSRARNLLRCAKVIHQQYNGKFPDTLQGLLELPGIGPYTAAAIASFAFQLPVPAIDGNVERILSRIWGVETPINSPQGKKQLSLLANTLVDPIHPHQFNQAMMDFGALQCMPRKPLCEKCPFRQNCTAHLNIKTTAFPVKIKKNEKKRRCFHYLVLMSGADVLVRQRPKGDIWTALWEFPLVEAPSIDISPEALRIASPWLQQLPQATLTHSSKTYRQTLTHQQIAARFWVFQVDPNLPATKNKEWQRIPWKSLKEIALPGIIRSYLEDKNLSIHFQ